MRVLLDEDLPVRLRHYFGEGTQVETVEYRGWKGVKNGELLRRAQEHFDVFVTMDNNLPAQQNLSRFDIAVVILRARSKELGVLASLIPEVERRLPEVRPGQAIHVEPPTSAESPGAERSSEHP